MTKHIIAKNRTTEFDITKSGDEWILTAGVGIETADPYGINIASSANDTSLTLKGSIVMEASTAAVGVFGDGSSVTLADTGRIEGLSTGIALHGDGASFVNHGQIRLAKGTEGAGVWADGKENTIENHGLIRSSQGYAIAFRGGEQTLLNDGTLRGASVVRISGEVEAKIVNDADGWIEGTATGIYAEDLGSQFSFGASATGVSIVNKGYIGGESAAVVLAGGSDRIVNDGKINGAVFLGEGDDRFIMKAHGSIGANIDLSGGNDTLDLRFGTIKSKSIRGGAGDDLYSVSNQDTAISEQSVGGYDTVRSTVSYTLGSNFEALKLIGSKTINATGNALDNVITGNGADNRLNGMEGDDLLSGGKGDDRLTGGIGGDTFVFGLGFGRDVVTDFQNGVDKVNYAFDGEISDVADLLANHAEQVGKDLHIRDGNDVLVLKNVLAGNLDASDFTFSI